MDSYKQYFVTVTGFPDVRKTRETTTEGNARL